MADVVAVLVVPAAGDPGGLLRIGTLCAIPPVAYQYVHRDEGVWEHGPADPRVVSRPDLWTSQRIALAIWWNGALVPEGWDRARRVCSRQSVHPAHHPMLTDSLEGCERDIPARDACEWLAVELVRHGLASRVVRLARVDGRLVEVP